MKEQIKTWYFTFGFGHKDKLGNSLANCYTSFRGSKESTRTKMFQAWGNQWAFQYESKEDAGVKRFNLRYIKS